MDVTESENILARVRAGAEQFVSLEEVKAKYQDDARPTKKTARPRNDNLPGHAAGPSPKISVRGSKEE
jgi:hypothetical protein